MNQLNKSQAKNLADLICLASTFCSVFLLVILMVPLAHAKSRVALVIGNSDYVHAADLANPHNDAAQIKHTLEAIGFDVASAFDLDHSGMLSALRSFKRLAKGSDIALIYYAGHGIEVRQRNYLVPIDARFDDEDDAEFNMVSLKLLSSAMSGVAGISMIMLDACRDNPFSDGRSVAGSRGLAPVEPVRGTLISYAARAGTKASDGDGKNSPYANALIKHLQEPQVDIRRVFDKVRDTVMTQTNNKQEPFVYASLPAKDIYLNPSLSTQESLFSDTATDIELKYWGSVEHSGSPELIQSYLDKYPNGEFAAIAKFMLGYLRPKHQDKPPNTPIAKAEPNEPKSDDVEKVKYFRLAANQGQPYSQYLLGRAYETGKGVDKNYSEAVKWYALSANQGFAAAQYNLGMLYQLGFGVDKDISKAIELLEKAAAQDDLFAIRELSFIYYTGDQVEQDFTKAFQYDLAAADQGDKYALNSVGMGYEFGRGVAEDKTKAAEYYQKSAQAGYAFAHTNLATLYRFGSGVPQDILRAIELYKMAAETDEPTALYFLGRIYEAGEGVAKDHAKAIQYYKLADKNGSFEAKDRLDELAQQ